MCPKCWNQNPPTYLKGVQMVTCRAGFPYIETLHIASYCIFFFQPKIATMAQLSPEQLAALGKEDKGPLTKSIVITFTTIAFICVCLRLFTRLKLVAGNLGREDYTIVISMVGSIITAIFQYLQVNAGNGKHAIFLSYPEDTIKIMRWLFWSILFYNITLTFVKISILLQYSRIFTVRQMRIPLHIVMTICVLWGITNVFTSIFSCVPVNAYWQVEEQANAKCIDSLSAWYSNASINILTDLMIAFLPVQVIWNLQIEKRQKMALMAILTVGWFVCIVSIVRLHELIVFANHPEDPTWYSAGNAYWSSIEMNMAIVCATVPALKPLVVKVVPSFSKRHNSGGYGTGMSGGSGSKRLGIRSTVKRTVDEEIEMGSPSSKQPYAKDPVGDAMYSKNIFVSTQLEQQFEEISRVSDSESQKDLVAEPKSVFGKH
ncbi:hypothetical protein BDW02DRAFT_303026 [Decorospora gaudefroyi]|uniref:Rhodopsin domain-containing protein n=1 Tax=Decorospora gaudefroyi TaxID=184978 RepID=A0A6A5K0I6_9PLEO|nr:hypothetical protein BDW02DRAFT_303026 [Decorospora gaudefroyi]